MNNWNNIRKRIVEMALNDYRYVRVGNPRVHNKVYEDATVQKFMQPLIHAWGQETAFEVFCENFDKTISDAVDTGIISADDIKQKRASKKRRIKQVSEDELSAPNSGMAG
jgi:hypothetical protein